MTLACQPVNEQLLEATQTSGDPGLSTLSPTPCLGCSRALPFPAGSVVETDHWTVQVLETIRGEEAWEVLYEANYFNDPPGEDHEYLLVKYRLENKDRFGEDRDLMVHVTGSSLRLVHSFDYSVVEPEPVLETNLAAGQSSEGWEAYRIRNGERNVLVVIEEWFNDEDPIYYLALEEGNAIAVSESALESVDKTNIGKTLAEPAVPGQISTSNHWQLSVAEVVVGEPAWKMAYDTNQFNDPPPDGMQYIAMFVKARYIGTDDAGADIDAYDFELIDAAGEEFERPSLVMPEPELDYHFYPGGDGEGWVILQAPEDAEDVILRFVPDYDENSPNTRYHALLQYGR